MKKFETRPNAPILIVHIEKRAPPQEFYFLSAMQSYIEYNEVVVIKTILSLSQGGEGGKQIYPLGGMVKL